MLDDVLELRKRLGISGERLAQMLTQTLAALSEADRSGTGSTSWTAGKYRLVLSIRKGR